MKKVLVIFGPAVALSATPAFAYTSTKYLHSYNSNAYTQQVGLCDQAPNFPFRWRPCWWV